MQQYFHVNENQLNQRLLSRYKTWACYACGLDILLGLMVLLGWAFDIPIFRSIYINQASVNPLTAVCLTLSGLSLYILVLAKPSQAVRYMGLGLALFISLVGFYRRLTHTMGWDFTWDQWLFADMLAKLGNDPTNLMSPHTAFNFLLLSLSLFLQQWCSARYGWFSQLLVLILSSIGLISLVSYVYQIDSYYTTDRYVMSFYTALGFIGLGFSFLFGTARVGFMQVLASQGSGGIMARRLLPLVLLVTFLLDFLRLGAQHANFYYTASVLISFSLPLFFILICWNAWSLNRSEDLLSGVLNSSIDGVIAFQAVRDKAGVIQDFTYILLNNASEQLLGRSREDLLNKRILIEFPGTKTSLFNAYVKVVETGEPLHHEFFYESDEFQNWFLVKAVKYEDGLVANFTDTTQQRKTQEKINKNELLLQQSQEIGKVGSFDWDIVLSTMTGSQQLYRILGYTYPEEIDAPKFFARVHPEDRKKVNNYILLGLTTLEEYDIEFRIIIEDQFPRFIWTKGKLFFDSQGKPERMIGTMLDITEKKKVEEEIHQKNMALQRAYEELVTTQEELRETNEALEHRVADRTEELIENEVVLRQMLEQTVDLYAKLQQSEGFLSSILDQSPIATWIADASGNQIRVNDAYLRLFGIDNRQWKPKQYNLLEDLSLQQEPYFQDIKAVFAEGKIARFTNNYSFSHVNHADIPAGVPITLVGTIFPIKNAQGKVMHAVVQQEDITQRKLAREAVRASQERYQAFVQQSSEAIWRIELAGIPSIDITLSVEQQIDLCYQYAYLAECNDTMARMYGFSSADEMVGIKIAEMLPPSEPANLRYIRSFIQAGYRLTDAESIEMDVQGNKKYFLNNLTGFIEEGKLIRLWGIQRDITSHKQAEQEREELLKREQAAFAEADRQRARWQGLFIQAPAIICIFRGPDHIIDFVNPACQALFTNRTFLGKFVRNSSPEGEVTGIFVYLDQVYATGEAFVANEMEVLLDRSNNGVLSQSFFNFVFQAIRDTTGTIEGILVFATEVTDQVRARRVVEENVEKFRLLLESIPQMAWTALPNGLLNYCNQRWYEYTGYTPQQSLGKSWTQTQHPEEMSEWVEKWSTTIAKGETFVHENHMLRAADQTFRWHLTRAVPIRNAENKIILWVGTSTDIHDQKLALEKIASAQEQLSHANEELNQTNLQLRKINDDLDNFVYTASHDLKAPMANLEGLVALLSRQLNTHANREEQAIIDMMLISVNKFNQTIRDMTDITKVQKSLSDAAEMVGFAEVLADVKSDITQLMLSVNACITTDFAVDKIYFARKNLRSILYNLVSNAIKYHSPDRPSEVQITTRQEAHGICLIVRDNGLGIESEQQPKLFGMFKRLHTHVEGTGIGLYIVKKIVDNYGGNIEVESVLGEGTTFTIYLPTI
ncbi:MAG: PAS domain S-box protein [Bacteroidota bacterium]